MREVLQLLDLAGDLLDCVGAKRQDRQRGEHPDLRGDRLYFVAARGERLEVFCERVQSSVVGNEAVGREPKYNTR